MEVNDLQSEKSLLMYVEEAMMVLWSKFQLPSTIMAPRAPAENFMLKICHNYPPPLTFISHIFRGYLSMINYIPLVKPNSNP